MWLARSEVHMRSLTQVANVPAERNCAELLFLSRRRGKCNLRGSTPLNYG